MSVSAASKARTSHIPLVDIHHNLESRLDTIVLNVASLRSLDVILSGEAQHVEGVFASQRDELAAVTPVELLRLDFDSPDQSAACPVEKADSALAFDTEQDTAT